MSPARSNTAPHVSAIVLAGGRATRLGGIDKGWYRVGDTPLISHTLARLAGQVDDVVISANRSLARYQALGHRAVADTFVDYAGPLAGIAAALPQVRHAYALIVPVDTPKLPLDLAERLCEAMNNTTDLVVASSPRGRQPLHCLVRGRVLDSLRLALANGERRVMRWQDSLSMTQVAWSSDTPFLNINRDIDADQVTVAGPGETGVSPSNVRDT